MAGGTNGQHRTNIPPTRVTEAAVADALQRLGLGGMTVHEVTVTRRRVTVLWRPTALPYQGSMAPLRRDHIRIVEEL